MTVAGKFLPYDLAISGYPIDSSNIASSPLRGDTHPGPGVFRSNRKPKSGTMVMVDLNQGGVRVCMCAGADDPLLSGGAPQPRHLPQPVSPSAAAPA